MDPTNRVITNTYCINKDNKIQIFLIKNIVYLTL